MFHIEKQLKGSGIEDTKRIEIEKYLGILKRSNSYTSGLVSGALAKTYPDKASSDSESYQNQKASRPTLVHLGKFDRPLPSKPELVNVNRLSKTVQDLPVTTTSTSTFQPNNNNNDDQVYLG